MASIRVGLFPPVAQLDTGPERLQALLARVADAGVDHVCVGDHVSFFIGAGSDGLITATSLLAAEAELPVYVGLYLLPFERYSPYGTPELVAEFLSPYVEAGCSAFNVIPCARDEETAVAAVGELRALLTGSRTRPSLQTTATR